MATLTKITESKKGNLVGHIRVQEKQVFQGMNVEIDQFYFVRLADRTIEEGPIEGFDIKAWDIEISKTNDGAEFKWITPKI